MLRDERRGCGSKGAACGRDARQPSVAPGGEVGRRCRGAPAQWWPRPLAGGARRALGRRSLKGSSCGYVCPEVRQRDEPRLRDASRPRACCSPRGSLRSDRRASVRIDVSAGRDSDGPTSERLRRREARAIIGAYHDEQLRTPLEHVRTGFPRLDAGEMDPFELDDLIHHYKRSARELWRFCGSSGSTGSEPRGPWRCCATAEKNRTGVRPARSALGADPARTGSQSKATLILPSEAGRESAASVEYGEGTLP